jgi:glycosyltransferase involved in cell wall biosynthesis
LNRVEELTVPFLQAAAVRTLRHRAAATMAVFESEGHGLAMWRMITGRRSTPLVIVSCWLADLARSGGSLRRRIYRTLYRNVDGVTVFSSNQIDTLQNLLGIPRERIHHVRFGVDLDELSDVTTDESGAVVAVGRDLGRDWATLAEAARGTDWDVHLATRPLQSRALDLPPQIEVHGTLARSAYLDLLANATVVALPSFIREYPTGQTVLLEAMALGKACVVTDTPAMREYARDGETALLVPPQDATALRAAIQRLLDDADLRHRLGDAARREQLELGGAGQMWDSIGEVLTTLVDRRPAGS